MEAEIVKERTCLECGSHDLEWYWAGYWVCQVCGAKFGDEGTFLGWCDLSDEERKVTLSFRWYDLWVGAYIDRKYRKVYICPLPTIVLCIPLR